MGLIMKIRKIIPYMLLFLIVLFEDEAEKEGDEINMEPEEVPTNEKEPEDIEYTVIRESKYFEMPDEIILYNKGAELTVKKNTETYNKIVYITNERFKKDCGMAEEALPDECIEEFKNKLAIEFIYDKEIHTIYKCYDYRYEKNYAKILFPLPDSRAIFGPYESENQNEYYQEYQNGPLRVSVQPESDYLIEIIEAEFSSR